MAIQISRDCRELLEHQHGVLARWQAADVGLDRMALDALLRHGRWQATYRGVYAAYTGNVPRPSTLWAAVLRCGPHAALSHHTAAELDGLRDTVSDAIHVTIPSASRVRLSKRDIHNGLPGIVLYRSARLVEARHPVRTPPRTRVEETVLDLTELAPGFDVAFGWLSTACSRRLVTASQLRAAADRRGKMRWRAEIRAALADISDGVHSPLENLYLRNVERPHRLPKVLRQARMQGRSGSAYLDNLFEEFAVAVELDGRASHPLEARWRDIHRDNYFARTGIITLRYSWADVTERPCEVAMEVAMVLRQRGWKGTIRACQPACPVRLS